MSTPLFIFSVIAVNALFTLGFVALNFYNLLSLIIRFKYKIETMKESKYIKEKLDILKTLFIGFIILFIATTSAIWTTALFNIDTPIILLSLIILWLVVLSGIVIIVTSIFSSLNKFKELADNK